MPELPEVETARSQAQRHLGGRKIISVFAAKDPIIFKGTGSRKIANTLKGKKVLGFERKGKYIWMKLARGPSVLFHFGMTGRFHFYRKSSERPRFCKLELKIEGGKYFAMTNIRRFGRIRLMEDPLTSPPVSKLGFDVLKDRLETKSISRILGSRKAAIKAVLLDQKVFAGVGNWIADEVLYQAGIDPRRLAHRLNQEQVRKIILNIRRVVKKAVEVRADNKRFPKTWLFHDRWSKKANAQTFDGKKIKFCRVGGKTTAYVPLKQK